MTLPDKIKALPLPPSLARLLKIGDKGGERCYTEAQMRALLDAAATLAAEHEARAQALAEALEDTAQSLCWLAFGECRNIVRDRPVLNAHEAEAKALAALRAWKESQ